MEQVLLVIQVIVTLALIGIVLLQRSDSDGFGLGSGSGANLLSGRSAANLLTRTTAILAAVFIINSLALSILASQHQKSSLIDTLAEAPATEAPVAEEVKKDAPSVPNAGAEVKKEVPAKLKAKAKKPVEDSNSDNQ